MSIRAYAPGCLIRETPLGRTLREAFEKVEAVQKRRRKRKHNEGG